MKFVLTYDGDLPPTVHGSHKVEKKWEIRKHFHPQLDELWRVHPALIRIKHGVRINPDVPTGHFLLDYHHEYEGDFTPIPPLRDGERDLCEPIVKGTRLFKPLVRKSFALTYGLKISFLRKEKAGRVYQDGDLDNRMKTLLDALSVPAHPVHVITDNTIEDPILCLLEDDSLITGLSVETERLLSRPNTGKNEVRLTIEVDIRVTDSRTYNSLFLGD